MTTQEMTKLVEQQLDAYNLRDLDAFCACFHPEVTGSTRFPDGLHTTAIYGFRDGLIDRVWFPR